MYLSNASNRKHFAFLSMLNVQNTHSGLNFGESYDSFMVIENVCYSLSIVPIIIVHNGSQRIRNILGFGFGYGYHWLAEKWLKL